MKRKPRPISLSNKHKHLTDAEAQMLAAALFTRFFQGVMYEMGRASVKAARAQGKGSQKRRRMTKFGDGE